MTGKNSVTCTIKVEGVGEYTFESFYVPGYVRQFRPGQAIPGEPLGEFMADFAVAFGDAINGAKDRMSEDAYKIYQAFKED